MFAHASDQATLKSFVAYTTLIASRPAIFQTQRPTLSAMPHEDAIYPTTKLSKNQPDGDGRNHAQICLLSRSCAFEFTRRNGSQSACFTLPKTAQTTWGRTKWERANLPLSKTIVNTTDEKTVRFLLPTGA
jgi:hypothetical protein